MSVSLINFPLSSCLDGILSYTQFVFGNALITPAEYRWNKDDRKSRIRICAPFVIDNEKPMSIPFIVIERGTFGFANRTLDNLRGADINSFENPEKVDWADGSINLIFGSNVAGEASSIANFLAIQMQADRRAIMETIQFIRNFHYIDVSPEIPVVKDVEIRRWEVTLRMFCSLQMGWAQALIDPQKWNKANITGIDRKVLTDSLKGSTVKDSDEFVDTTKHFGFELTDNPQFLESEFEKKWYYLRIKKDNEYILLTIIDITDEHTLKLEYHDEDNLPVPWAAPSTAANLSYEILWNSLHIKCELPKP